MDAASGDIFCILNNDIIVTPNWLGRMTQHFNYGVDMVGPRTNYIDGSQILLIDQYDNKEELYQSAEKYYQDHAEEFWPCSQLVGFCLVLKREVYECIGGLNEEYGLGNWEDNDFCLRSINDGFKIGIARGVYIHHFGSVTHKILNIDYNKLIEKNGKIFNARWSKEQIERLSELNGDKND